MTCEINPIFVNIPSGQTTSLPFYLPNAAFIGIIFPAAMTGTKISIEVSHHPTTGFVSMKHFNPSGYSITFASYLGGAMSLTEDDHLLVPFSNFRFVADAAQAADRTLIVVGKG